MKLDTKRTVLVGFAFLSICTFWQLYDNLVPLILSGTFNIDKTVTGVIMAADNIVALFLLPLFGNLSDKCKSPLGRRRPFIFAGTLAAVALMMFLPILDNSHFSAPSSFKAVAFIGVLALLLIAMGSYRSPAVALMPDVTPKPLRSKANAIINLMGAIGGIIYLIITTFLYSKSRVEGLEHVNYLPIFIIVGGIMVLALLILLFFINEPELCKKQALYEAEHPEQQLTVKDEQSGKERMPKPVKKSLVFLLLSIAFWFIGYNAVSTWFSTYATDVWGIALGSANLCLTIATAGAIVSYIPVGVIASKLGRKKVIIFGVVLLSSSFLAAFIYTLFASTFSPILYVLFVLIGVAWASINVNSLPMVIEMCSGSEVGRYTGLYYTFSMTAQVVTPIVAGFLYDHVSRNALFLYAALAVALAFVTMMQVKHGDNKVETKKGLEAFDVED